MIAHISPSILKGTVGAIASKSEAHRQLILAALSGEPSVIAMRGISDDIEATCECLTALGARFEFEENRVSVAPLSRTASAQLNARESGSTLRFLLPVACALTESASFTGCGRLPERPLTHLVDAMKSGGAKFSSDRLPLTVTGGMKAGVYRVPGNISSQYVTGLLLALPLLDGDSEIIVEGALASRAYVDITLRAMRNFSIEVKETDRGYLVPGNQTPKAPENIIVDGDWSNAAFFLAAGAIGNTGISVSGLDENAAQGDKRIVPLLQSFGARISKQADTFTVTGGSLRAARIDIGEVPDLIAPLAVTAMFAEGQTVFENGARLRLKESDRINAMRDLILSLGGIAKDDGDRLIVTGKRPTGGNVNGANDHRIVMAAAIAGAYCPEGARISDAQAVRKSYPSFFEDFQSAGGIAYVQ